MESTFVSLLQGFSVAFEPINLWYAFIGCLIGTTQELSIGTAAQAHLAAAMPNLTHPSDPTGPLLYVEDVVQEPVRYVQGHLLVPQGIGLGVALDDEKLAELRRDLKASGETIVSSRDRVVTS